VCVSAPALVRAAIIKQNSIGVNCKPYYEAHQPIPSAFLNQLVAERLREHEVLIRGYVLVGYPLSKDQAQFMLQSGLAPDSFSTPL
jgi:adenylate kinase